MPTNQRNQQNQLHQLNQPNPSTPSMPSVTSFTSMPSDPPFTLPSPSTSSNRIQPHLSPLSPLDQIDLIGKLADLKEDHYQNAVLLSAIIELLIDKGVFTAQELTAKAQELDASFNLPPTNPTP